MVSSGAEYGMAKGVYKGRLVKLERNNEERYLVRYYFEIDHTYKGPEIKALTLAYVDTDCRRPFEVGGNYLIYEEAREIQRYCNRTELISGLKQDLDLLDRFSTDKPLLKIEGSLPGFSDATDKPKIKIRSKDGFEAVSVDGNGTFSAVVMKKQTYIVQITFPGQGRLEVTDGQIDYRNSIRVTEGKLKTVLEYDVDLTKTFSDNRYISFSLPIQ